MNGYKAQKSESCLIRSLMKVDGARDLTTLRLLAATTITAQDFAEWMRPCGKSTPSWVVLLSSHAKAAGTGFLWCTASGPRCLLVTMLWLESSNEMRRTRIHKLPTQWATAMPAHQILSVLLSVRTPIGRLLH